MPNRFCSSCGAQLLEGASFCVECGTRQGGTPAARARVSFPLQRWAPALVILAVVLAAGAAVWLGALSPKTPQTVARRGAEQGADTGGGTLPQGHPPIAIPEEVKQAINDLAKKAEAAPDDLETWKHLGDVQYRAAQINPSYLAQAAATYQHILEREPNNLDVIRNLGNIAFDQDRHEEAVGYYERYLKQKPDDPDVQTDLGTMYLSDGKTDEAIKIYDAVLRANPSFFQAQFNLAIAYRSSGQTDKMIAALEKARTLATDDSTRNQVDQLLARAKGGGAAAKPAAPGNAAAASAPAGTFEADTEAMFRQAPIIGPKVDRLEWSGPDTAKVVLRDFPMDEMPEEMKTMFTDRMRARIKEQKDTHKVATATHFDFVDAATGKVMVTIAE